MGTLKSPVSQVLSDTSLKVFFGTKAWESCTPAFLWGGGRGVGAITQCSPCSATYVELSGSVNFFAVIALIGFIPLSGKLSYGRKPLILQGGNNNNKKPQVYKHSN